MKNYKLISVFPLFSALLFAAPSTSWALSSFNSESGNLVLPEVVLNETTFIDSVTLKLNFATKTFEVIGFAEKPPTIHQDPIDSVTQQDIKMDLLGCARTTRTQVTCHLMLTSVGGVDAEIRVNGKGDFSKKATQIFDDLGNTYKASEVTVGNLQGSTNEKYC